LGNVRAVFAVTQQGTAELRQKTDYYPFGMVMNQTEAYCKSCPPNKFLYNGKEIQDDVIAGHKLEWYDYGARMYDAAVGRWHVVDPLAEKYAPISPYVYVANNPIIFIDPDGKQISFSYQYQKDEDGKYVLNQDGNKILTGVTMHVTGVVMNVSSKSANLDAATRRISSYIEKSFNGVMLDGVSFTTEVDLRAVESMSEVKDTDHIFALADFNPVYDAQGVKRTPWGIANNFGGKVAFIDVDYFRGPWDTTYGNVGPNNAAHEFGHLALAVPPGTHSTGGYLMDQGHGNNWSMFSSEVPAYQLSNIYRAFHKGMLNIGPNVEQGRLGIKRPNRGMARGVVIYN